MKSDAHKGGPSFTRFIVQDRSNLQYLLIAIAGMIIQLVVFKRLYPLFVQLAALYFFFTLLYFYRPGRSAVVVLFIFLFFNPLILYVCNYVSGDSIFAGLSLLWVTQLLWLIHRPKLYRVFMPAFLLLLAFSLSYNAMRSGWMQASNALYRYPYIEVDSTTVSPAWIPLHRAFEFTKYYLLPNIKNHLMPVPEKQGMVLFLFSALLLVLNLYFMCCCIWLLVTGDIRKLPPAFLYALWLVVSVLLSNFCFSVFAAPVVLRYPVFPMIVCFAFAVLVTDFVRKIKVLKPPQ